MISPRGDASRRFDALNVADLSPLGTTAQCLRAPLLTLAASCPGWVYAREAAWKGHLCNVYRACSLSQPGLQLLLACLPAVICLQVHCHSNRPRVQQPGHTGTVSMLPEGRDAEGGGEGCSRQLFEARFHFTGSQFSPGVRNDRNSAFSVML